MNSKENERPQRCSTVFDGSEPVAWNCPPETLLTLEDWKWVDEMCRRHAELCSLVVEFKHWKSEPMVKVKLDDAADVPYGHECFAQKKHLRLIDK